MPEEKKNAPRPVKPGMVFGFLEVIEKTDPYRPPGGGKPTAQWKCRCQLCGNEITLTASSLHRRKNKSCGCTNDGTKSHARPIAPGMVFGYLEVMEKTDPYVPPGKGRPRARWKCRCKLCGNEITVTTDRLYKRKNKSCGCTDEGTGKKPSVTPGMVFGELEVKERAPDHFTPSGIKKPCWVCECSCGTRVTVQQQVLVQGRKWHCGCKRGAAPSGGKQGGRYDLTGAYGVGYTNKGEPFWFDLEDYQKIKDYTWYYNRDGYLMANVKGQNPVLLHRLVMPEPPEGMVIDHKEHPPGRRAKRIDNRKSNLRFATIAQNCQNRCLRRDNTSGATGVYERNNRWLARIKHGKKHMQKSFPLTNEGFKDACAWREEMEHELFGEYKYQEGQHGTDIESS